MRQVLRVMMNAEKNRHYVESMESRVYWADSFAFITGDGTLQISGTSLDNEITVIVGSDLATVTRDGEALSFPAAQVTQIRVEAGRANDRVTVVAPQPCTLLGESGHDTLAGGSGNDSLNGGPGDDVLDGGAGDDHFEAGSGFDTVDYFSRNVGFSFVMDIRRDDGSLPPEPFTEDTPYGTARTHTYDEQDTIGYFIESIGGTSNADSFDFGVTGDVPRVFDGRSGDDDFIEYSGDQFMIPEVTLIGGAGNDRFFTADWTHETIFAGSGDDYISVHELAFDDRLPDALDAGPGRDVLSLRTWDSIVFDMRLYPGLEDVFIGSQAAMTIIGNDLSNNLESYRSFPVTVYGMGGNDTLEGGTAGDRLFGGDGDDLLIGGLGNDTLRGEGGNDALGGNAGADKLFGHSGNDAFNGGSGNDRLYGDSGVDTFVGGAGNDTFFARDNIAEGLHGGPGQDSAQHDSGLDVLFEVEETLV